MNVVELAISIIAPHNCVICSSRGGVLCENCALSQISPLISRCIFCNTLTQDYKVCSNCAKKSGLRHVFVASAYKSVEKIVHGYKFDGKRALAKDMSQAMLAELPFADYDAVVAVPTAPSRIRTRAFDHTKLLVKPISKQLKLPFIQPLIHTGKLRQVGAKQSIRKQQAKQSYQLKVATELTGKRILLVDDVVTTGATLGVCANLLKQAGAKSIDALAFARRA